MVIEILQENLYQSVSDFYNGKSVFLTGATGFLGKVLLERLLWTCPKIDKIYILVREKKGVHIEKRVEEILDNVLFSKLKEKKRDELRKIVAIAGDMNADNLGMSQADEEILIEKVAVVVHVAATIKFNETLAQVLKTNLEGTSQILSLCHRMKMIEVFAHASTAYSNTDKNIIEEIVYPPPADINDVYLCLKENDPNANYTKFLRYHPNTYTFSKALTENLIVERQGNFMSIIIRPSIVTAIAKDPLPGWVDNWFGATAILTSISKGINRMLWGEKNNVIDFIPVDYVANFFLVAIAKSRRSTKLAIYNCCSSYNNPTTICYALQMFVRDSIEHKDYIFPFPQYFFISNNLIFGTIVTFLLQIIPAALADFMNWILGRPVRCIKLQQQVISRRDAVKYFTLNSWIMRNEAAMSLVSSLSPDDKEKFQCDATKINWKEYMQAYSAGVRRYLEGK